MKLFKKSEKLKNQALLKRGTYSLAITAIVLVGIILLNVFVRIIDDRFPLEYDMTADKVNTISDENIEFIKNVDTPVEIIVCADKDSYAERLVSTFYEASIYIMNESVFYEYGDQTIKLIEKYQDYNDNITVKFIDPESSEFMSVMTEYSDYMSDGFIYGDLIVTARINDVTRIKTISFAEIYQFEADSSLASLGYYYNVTGNRIESALTSAIGSTTVSEIKKVALIKGHSAIDYGESFTTLLHKNGFEVEAIMGELLTQIPDKYDAVAIIAPTTDFVEAELDVLSAFLDNDGVLGKGLIYYGDASSGYLPNLSDFLSEWGIKVESGVLFETNSSYFYPGNPMTLQFGAADTENKVSKASSLCVTGNNVPLTKAFDSTDDITVTTLFASSGGTVAAPVGVSAQWTGAANYTKGTYYGGLEAKKLLYVNNEKCESYVYAFSSVDFAAPQSTVAVQYTSNSEAVTLAAAQSAAGLEDTSVSFTSKVITENAFTETATESEASIIRTIFMFIIPLALIVVAIIVYIRRRNA